MSEARMTRTILILLLTWILATFYVYLANEARPGIFDDLEHRQ